MTNVTLDKIKFYGLSVCVYLFFTIYESYLLILSLFKGEMYNSRYKITKINKNSSTNIEICKVDATDGIEKHVNLIQENIKKNKPTIIKNIPKILFTELYNIYEKEKVLNGNTSNDNKLIMRELYLPKLLFINEFVKYLTKRSILYMASFAGKYASGYAHIDSFQSNNVYYVVKGSKRVLIIPHEYTPYVSLKPGIDSVYCNEDSPHDDKHLEWLKNVPEYYLFTLEEGDLLIFNNSGCIHKFTNITGNEYIFTMRTSGDYVSPLVLRNDIFNWKMAKHYANIILTSVQFRTTANIENVDHY